MFEGQRISEPCQYWTRGRPNGRYCEILKITKWHLCLKYSTRFSAFARRWTDKPHKAPFCRSQSIHLRISIYLHFTLTASFNYASKQNSYLWEHLFWDSYPCTNVHKVMNLSSKIGMFYSWDNRDRRNDNPTSTLQEYRTSSHLRMTLSRQAWSRIFLLMPVYQLANFGILTLSFNHRLQLRIKAGPLSTGIPILRFVFLFNCS